jgi:predicted TIM-barrel fold metal-dependent hydrolase
MARELDIIDADGHITEPEDLWEKYIDQKYRDTCPKITTLNDGTLFRIDDRITIRDYNRPLKTGVNTASTFGARTGDVPSDRGYDKGEPGGFDPHERIKWMDSEGYDGSILYPTMALSAVGVIIDPDRQAAVSNAYNRWIADFCAPYTDRLFGAALIPLLSVEAALTEIENIQKLGLKVGSVRPNPVGDRPLHDPHFYPVWDACQAAGLAIAVHGVAAMANLGMDRFDSQANYYRDTDGVAAPKCHSFSVEHCFTHTAEMMAAITSFVMAGVCDKFPKLRVAFVESGAGWVPGYIDRMDRHFDDVGMNDTGLLTRPSEIFQRQCFVSFEPVERTVAALAEFFSPQKMMLSSDYPHGDGFPNSIQMVRDMNLKPEIEKALFADGFKAWYGLN